MEDAVIISMEAVMAKVEEIKAKAKLINIMLDAATGRMTTKIKRSLQLALSSIWRISLCLGTKEALM